MRSIGDRTYTTNQNIVDEEVKDETIQTTLAGDEIANFSRRIGTKILELLIGLEIFRLSIHSSPLIGERSTGIMKTFFKKLDDFLN
jgi:hypothetical protein